MYSMDASQYRGACCADNLSQHVGYFLTEPVPAGWSRHHESSHVPESSWT